LATQLRRNALRFSALRDSEEDALARLLALNLERSAGGR
jgi:hypothetical protein